MSATQIKQGPESGYGVPRSSPVTPSYPARVILASRYESVSWGYAPPLAHKRHLRITVIAPILLYIFGSSLSLRDLELFFLCCAIILEDGRIHSFV